MKVTLISEALYDEINKLITDNPELVFDNQGYEYLSFKVCNDKSSEITRIAEILREHVVGFSKFFNFKKKRGKTFLRFDYDWGAANSTMHFIGVGYLDLEHLRYGFPEEHQ